MIHLGRYDLESGNIKVLEGGLNSLLSIPTSIEPDKNDWGDEDGIEVDLLNGLKLEPHKVEISIYASSKSDADQFVSELQLSHTHTLSVYERLFELRPIGYELKLIAGDRQEITLSAVAKEQIGSVSIPSDYNPLTEFAILQDSERELCKYSSVKEGHSNGYHYIGGSRVLRKSKEVELSLLLSVNSWSELWQKRDVLRAWLTSPDIKHLSVDRIDLKGFYVNLDTRELLFSGDKIFWSALLRFCITEVE